MSLTAFLLATMIAWRAPLLADLPFYEEVAHDVADVAQDPNEAPLFEGDQGRERTALLLLGIAYYESGGFARDVDEDRRRGDAGKSHCLMQVQLRPGESLPNRTACIRIALARTRESFALCQRMQAADRLGGYVRGHCRANDPEARRRWRKAVDWWTAHASELATPTS